MGVSGEKDATYRNMLKMNYRNRNFRVNIPQNGTEKKLTCFVQSAFGTKGFSAPTCDGNEGKLKKLNTATATGLLLHKMGHRYFLFANRIENSCLCPSK